MTTHPITATQEYFDFDFVIFRRTEKTYTRVGTGNGKELLPQTVEAVEDQARLFIPNLGDWDSETMNVEISIHKVLELCLFVRNTADILQTQYKTLEDLNNAQLTAEDFRSGVITRCGAETNLNQARFFLVLFSAFI